MPQDKSQARAYSNQDIVKVLASPQFQSAPPETQMEVRRLLGVAPEPSSAPSTTSPWSIGPRNPANFERPTNPFRRALNWTLGSFGPDPQYQHKTILESVERSMRETGHQREVEDSHDPTRTMAGRAWRQYSPNVVADTASFLRGSGSGKNAGLGAVSMIPQARPFVAAYMLATSGKEILRPREPQETDADYLQRILFGSSGVVGSVALGKSGRLRSAKSEMNQRVNRLSFASGSGPGVPNAYQIALPDLVQTARSSNLPLKTLTDVARVVEATNQRFNARMALAEQPFAGDRVALTQAANDLRAAADDMAPSQSAEATHLRNLATTYDKPMSLRELGREVRHQNDLYRTHAGKTSLELSTAQTRADVAANSILRGSLRDIYVDYLESKYPGSGLREMRERQAQILKLRDALGEWNPQTKAFEGGHVERLKSDQAKFRGSPMGSDIHGVASQHGLKGYLKWPRSLSHGPETKANAQAKKALRDVPGHRLPTRQFKPLDEQSIPQAPPSRLNSMATRAGKSLATQMSIAKRIGDKKWIARIRRAQSRAEQARSESEDQE